MQNCGGESCPYIYRFFWVLLHHKATGKLLGPHPATSEIWWVHTDAAFHSHCIENVQRTTRCQRVILFLLLYVHTVYYTCFLNNGKFCTSFTDHTSDNESIHFTSTCLWVLDTYLKNSSIGQHSSCPIDGLLIIFVCFQWWELKKWVYSYM